MASLSTKVPIQSTAGAIPIKNEKGEITMEKVKVSRYISGKRPQYAQYSSDEDDDGLEFSAKQRLNNEMLLERYIGEMMANHDVDDRRLRRLQQTSRGTDEDRIRSHRLHEPEIVAVAADELEAVEASDEEPVISREDRIAMMAERRRREADEDREASSEEEEMLDEEEIEKRRMMLKERLRQKQQELEVMDVGEEEVDEADKAEEEEESEYEEVEESDDEDAGPRLKPVFVRKKDRITIQEKESELRKQRELEQEAKRLAEERRSQTLKMVEADLKREMEAKAEAAKAEGEGIVTDEENDEEEYEAWKVRELKRLKRDRDEREAIEREKAELDRIHSMTEEQRREELRNNPKVITNKAAKGKYKFLQKYYHRGVFYLDKEDTVLKRDFAQPTLEDHFDKTIVPKVMQVKNFGRSGRTKYTHLVDQDTTVFESPWIADTAMNLKFHTTKGGGQKQVFEKPTAKRK